MFSVILKFNENVQYFRVIHISAQRVIVLCTYCDSKKTYFLRPIKIHIPWLRPLRNVMIPTIQLRESNSLINYYQSSHAHTCSFPRSNEKWSNELNVHNIVIFSTTKNLSFLTQSGASMMNSTFYACSSLYTVHGKKKHTYVLLVCCHLDGKTIEFISIFFRNPFIITFFIQASACFNWFWA